VDLRNASSFAGAGFKPAPENKKDFKKERINLIGKRQIKR
jgi:hypothetical protein